MDRNFVISEPFLLPFCHLSHKKRKKSPQICDIICIFASKKQNDVKYDNRI